MIRNVTFFFDFILIPFWKVGIYIYVFVNNSEWAEGNTGFIF